MLTRMDLDFCVMCKADIKTRIYLFNIISILILLKIIVKGFKLGAVDYIAKPFEKEESNIRLDKIKVIYKMQQEMESYNKKLHQGTKMSR